MTKGQKIFVAGHRGMVGSAILRALRARGYSNVVTQTRAQLDLSRQADVFEYLARERPDYVFMAAAKVGGIQANNLYRAEFFYENLVIETNLIHGSYLAGVRRGCFLGSSCVYPRDCPQPIREEFLLTGPLEQTNEPYAIAKIAGVKMCEAYNAQYGTGYTSVMPTNLYGPNDNYDLQSSHVLPALLRKAHEAKQRNDSELVVWGSGSPRREFLHVDDLADACLFIMEKSVTNTLINVGTGSDVTIKDLAHIIMDVVQYTGKIGFDTSKPDGTPRKLLNVERLAELGWRSRTPLREGIQKTYQNFLSEYVEERQLGR